MYQVKPNYVVIPAITLIIIGMGRYFSDVGMDWYYTLILPGIIPAGWVFAVAWNILYFLLTIVALWLYNTAKRDKYWLPSIVLLAINAIANGLWTFFFFYNRLIFVGLIDCLVVLITAIALMLLALKQSRLMAFFLGLYVAWMLFATYTNYLIWQMN